MDDGYYPDWSVERIHKTIDRIEALLEKFGEPAQYDTIMVTVHQPYWSAQQLWLLAQCEEHEDSCMVSWCETELDRIELANTVRAGLCPEGSHER